MYRPDPIKKVRSAMLADPDNWEIPFFNFVDDFRYSKSPSIIAEPLELDHPRFDALLAATIEYLCDECGLKTPDWAWETPSLRDPWFVSGVENLKALAIVESPVFFRRRNIFVLENFLSRV